MVKTGSRKPAARTKQTAIRGSGPPRRSGTHAGSIPEERGQPEAGDLLDGDHQNVANPQDSSGRLPKTSRTSKSGVDGVKRSENTQKKSPRKRAGQPLNGDETAAPEHSGTEEVESRPDVRGEDIRVDDEGVEENPSSRKRARHAEQESDSGSEDGDDSSSRRDMNQNGEKIDLWEGFGRPNERVREEVRIERLWKDKVKKFKNKRDDPKRAFMLETVKEFCGKDPEKIFGELRLDDEDKAELQRKWKKDVGLERHLEMSREHLILTKFLMDHMEEESCFKLMNKLRLESGWERRNIGVWKAYKITRDCEDTMAFEEFRHKLRNEFNRTSSTPGKRQLARTTVKGDVIFVCILTKRTRKSKVNYSVAYFATDKQIPYLFVRGGTDEAMIESVSNCLGGTGTTSCNLSEVGLDTVIGICKQPTSATILATRGHEIQERVQAEERAVSFISLSQHLHSMNAGVEQEQPDRKFLAEVMKVEPEQGDGMKNLKLKFKQPGNKFITFKVTTKKGGSMSADLAAMYTRGTLSDSTRKAFLLAKDKKSNNLKLDWSEEDGGTWVADD